MNNLLKIISQNPIRGTLPETDLKLLLSSVSDIRSQDAKAADSFYASLESVLVELRTVTPDNRDAEAFLKPVSRTDYPDYYEIIEQPMDLGTMLKNVKTRKYKSKQEFATDLSLIWKNCFKYNSGPDHILRGCANRLKRKSEYLLAHVSDRPDRITINGLPTPSAPPSSVSSRDSPFKVDKVNGIMNGILAARSSMPSPTPTTPQDAVTPPTPGPSNSKSPHSVSGRSATKPSPHISTLTIPFEEQPAIIRTPGSMNLFLELDREMQEALENYSSGDSCPTPMLTFDTKGKSKESLVQRLHSLVEDDLIDIDEEGSPSNENDRSVGDVLVGPRKRKRPSSSYGQRKRLRMMDVFGTSDTGAPNIDEDLLGSWWEVAGSSALLAGGIPPLTQFGDINERKLKAAKRPHPCPVVGKARLVTKRPKGKKRSGLPKNSLLRLMNSNIATLLRIRRTHRKFVIINTNAEPTNAPLPPDPESEHELDEEAVLCEKGWRIKGEVDETSADECLNWMNGKILQHAGFQGTSHVALNVLTSVASEYLQSVGRTIRFLCDKFSNTMSAEEIILHTLFEGGISEIQDLERYIKDDVIRYGNRLGELEKKLVNAYHEVTSVDVPNYEALFEEGEEADQYMSGGLAEILGDGEDILGLRELGIEAELGLKSLTIPKRLWKGKAAGADRTAPDRLHAGEPPLPFPVPAPFLPLVASKVDSQIGLLKSFYEEKFKTLAANHPASTAPPEVATAVPTASSTSTVPIVPHPSLALPDEPPNPSRTKLGPLGQVIPTNPTTAANKKKGKAKEGTGDKPTTADKEGELPASIKKKDSKKKKPKEEQGGTVDGEDNPANTEMNDTGQKKKPKSSPSKKTVNGATKPMDGPPAIIASA